MTKLDNVRIDGRTGTWYEIDRDDTYILFESEQWGDEAGHILTDYDLNEVCETWGTIEEAIEDMIDGLDAYDYDDFDLEVGYDPYMGCYSDDC